MQFYLSDKYVKISDSDMKKAEESKIKIEVKIILKILILI